MDGVLTHTAVLTSSSAYEPARTESAEGATEWHLTKETEGWRMV